MTEIILNEKEYVERMLESHDLGKNPASTIHRVAKYYHAQGFNKSDVEHNLELFMVRCNPNINIIKWQKAIDHAVKVSSRYSLMNIPYIGITQAELDTIATLRNATLCRLMFTLLCLAKYGNAANEHNNGWINFDDKKVFSLANIQVTKKRQSLLMNDLMTAGFIGFSKVVDNTNTNVKIINDHGPIALKISTFRDLGNQYRRYSGEKYFECQCCGRIIKQKANAQKYCHSCASEIKNMNGTAKHLRIPAS